MNVFLGEPSDAVVSYADKRYYKHTVDAMNIDVSACYKVCEEKEATMPAEKTSSNLSATIQSIKGGYTGGDLDVPVTGSITGVDPSGYSVRGDVYGGVCGNVGNEQNYCGVGGTVYGDVGGDVCGNVCGIVYGSVGNVGNVCGFVAAGVGSGVCGSVCGDICGGVYGTIYCGVHGNIQDGVYGNIQYGVYGNIEGTVCGNVYGNIEETVYGKICGWYQPMDATGSEVLTLDQTPDDNAFLKIDLQGKSYYIHAN